jgi:hypothetical protein
LSRRSSAFEPGSGVPAASPTPPPIIPIGLFTTGVTSLTESGPLYGFASPGTLVGTWSVTLTETPVPEPATVVLLGSGLALLARRWRRRRE